MDAGTRDAREGITWLVTAYVKRGESASHDLPSGQGVAGHELAQAGEVTGSEAGKAPRKGANQWWEK